MKQPQHKRIQRHTLLKEPSGVNWSAVSQTALYVGSVEHKVGLSFAGKPAPREDASKCDPSLSNQQAAVENWLRTALTNRHGGGPVENGYPRYVWRKEGDVAYEARLTNRQLGAYKGYPIDPSECPLP